MRARTAQQSRRQFLAHSAAPLAALGAASKPTSGEDAIREFLRPYVVPRPTIDRFLDPEARVWARFDPELGYTLRTALTRDGLEGAFTLSRITPDGHRAQTQFPDLPCRIHTFGDSFTHGQQVSDGETWQEVLAAHFLEPIRNFGIGGYGVYQAFRRLLRIEQTDQGAPYVILNIFGDDHFRSILSWRWLTFATESLEHWRGPMFHANPWAHARLSQHGELVERPNPLPAPSDLYRLCELDELVSLFGQDEIVHLWMAASRGSIVSRASFEQVATACGLPMPDVATPELARASASGLLTAYSLRVSQQIVKRLAAWCGERGKSLLILLSHSAEAIARGCRRESERNSSIQQGEHPPAFVRFLGEAAVPFADVRPRHVAEFDTFRLSPERYVERYFIGHYAPAGNQFFAAAMRPDIVKWLDPPPPAYRSEPGLPARFAGPLSR